MGNEWWRKEGTEICLFHVPVGGGESHVLTLHGSHMGEGRWRYAIIQWWHQTPTCWLEWQEARLLKHHETVSVDVRPGREIPL